MVCENSKAGNGGSEGNVVTTAYRAFVGKREVSEMKLKNDIKTTHIVQPNWTFSKVTDWKSQGLFEGSNINSCWLGTHYYSGIRTYLAAERQRIMMKCLCISSDGLWTNSKQPQTHFLQRYSLTVHASAHLPFNFYLPVADIVSALHVSLWHWPFLGPSAWLPNAHAWVSLPVVFLGCKSSHFPYAQQARNSGNYTPQKQPLTDGFWELVDTYPNTVSHFIN